MKSEVFNIDCMIGELEINKVYNMDCIDGMKMLPDKCIDLVITDPPYMLGASSVAGSGNTKVSRFSDLLNQSFFYREILIEFKRILIDNSCIWMFSNWRCLPVMMKAIVESDLSLNSVLVWDKCWIGPGGIQGLRPSYELVLFIPLGEYQIPNRGLPDIWRSKWTSLKPSGHPAEKPLELCEKIVKENIGNIIIDPFMGSGTIAIAALKQNRNFIGFEIEPKYCEIANKRINAEKNQLKIFA